MVVVTVSSDRATYRTLLKKAGQSVGFRAGVVETTPHMSVSVYGDGSADQGPG